MRYDDFFRQATRTDKEPNGRDPYPFQRQFAEAAALPHLLRAPTGSGKTATAVLGWLYRWVNRKHYPETPRRLVYCLPMRVLVEQSEREAKAWIKNLRDQHTLQSDIEVHVLM